MISSLVIFLAFILLFARRIVVRPRKDGTVVSHSRQSAGERGSVYFHFHEKKGGKKEKELNFDRV